MVKGGRVPLPHTVHLSCQHQNSALVFSAWARFRLAARRESFRRIHRSQPQRNARRLIPVVFAKNSCFGKRFIAAQYPVSHSNPFIVSYPPFFCVVRFGRVIRVAVAGIATNATRFGARRIRVTEPGRTISLKGSRDPSHPIAARGRVGVRPDGHRFAPVLGREDTLP